MYSDTADLSGEHTPARGLTHTQAQQRLLAEGANELPLAGKRDLAAIVLEAVREPMFLLLLVAGVIYLLLGDISDALMLMGFVCVVLGITIYQQHKTERVLEALRDLTSPRALVLRDGVEQRIAGREVVRGDILILSEGDRVPADAALIACHDFAVDESLLTGESVAVRKIGHDQVQSQFESETRRRQASDEDSVTNTARSERGSQRSITDEVGLEPGGDDTPFVYSGTLVVQGHGTACVLATGQHTELGKIGKAMQELAIEATPLQQEITRLVRKLAIIGVLLSLLLVAIYGIVRNDWLHGLLAGITLAMSLLPEEFPLILIVFLAMGAWKISRHQVLTRRVPTVEALGSITVLCVDKTGTLTFNRMAVQQMVVGDASFAVGTSPLPLPKNFHELLGFAILSNEVSPFDPMEKAIHAFGTDHLADTEYLHHDWVLEKEYALSPQLLAHSHVWRASERDKYVVASKGAPEAVADLCHLDAAQLAALNGQINTLAAQGMRVLGVAKASYKGPKWPDTQHDFDFKFIGLIGLADPVRPTVTAALKECVAAGIRVVMITGDYPITAAAIARQIGLEA
ncbi:MAG: HAD-IC family P-type ATPase, partial [Gallionellaceae bacterium]|nr:HAD-IC family P-type ATPase [Gallionellaceae bacterium]